MLREVKPHDNLCMLPWKRATAYGKDVVKLCCLKALLPTKGLCLNHLCIEFKEEKEDKRKIDGQATNSSHLVYANMLVPRAYRKSVWVDEHIGNLER